MYNLVNALVLSTLAGLTRGFGGLTVIPKPKSSLFLSSYILHLTYHIQLENNCVNEKQEHAVMELPSSHQH